MIKDYIKTSLLLLIFLASYTVIDDANTSIVTDLSDPSFDELKIPQEKIKATNFHFQDIDSNTVSLDDFIGKYICIEIWGTWCAPCIKEMPFFEDLKLKYKDQDIVFVSIGLDSDFEKWKQFVLNKKLTDIQLIASNKSDLECYFSKINEISIFRIPRFVIIDKEGFIEMKEAPRPSGGKLEIQLNKLLVDK